MMGTGRKVDYVRYNNDVRLAMKPDSRGYRIRWVDPVTKRPRDTYRRNWQDAEALAMELAGLIQRQQTVDGTDADLAETPLVDMFDDYLAVARDRGLIKPQTWRTRRAYLKARVGPLVQGITCGEWDKEVTWRVVDGLRQYGLRDSTIASIVRAMSAAAHFANERKYLPYGVNPAKGIKVNDWRDDTIDPADLPTADDIEKLSGCMVEVTGQEWRTLQVAIAAYSGLRVGELLALHGTDVDLDAGTIRVERQLLTASGGVADPKYGSKRVTMFPEWLDDQIAGRVNEVGDGPMFPGTRSVYEPYSTFRGQAFNPARERAGWPRDDGRHRWTVHTLRHYFCTWALSKDGLDLDVADVQRFAGHRDPSTTWRLYVQTRPDRFNRAREASRRATR